ncbi:MAG: hypothetical protein SOT19_03215 [Muribaculaceae bacterium]|nr:hypothetical protein [Muribaculaceae bacterium]
MLYQLSYCGNRWGRGSYRRPRPSGHLRLQRYTFIFFLPNFSHSFLNLIAEYVQNMFRKCPKIAYATPESAIVLGLHSGEGGGLMLYGSGAKVGRGGVKFY